MANHHELKIWPQYFEHVKRGTKTFEYRRDDRGFCFGDIVTLKEWDPTRDYINNIPGPLGPPRGYTGKQLRFKIGYILPVPEREGFVVFSLLPL